MLVRILLSSMPAVQTRPGSSDTSTRHSSASSYAASGRWGPLPACSAEGGRHNVRYYVDTYPYTIIIGAQPSPSAVVVLSYLFITLQTTNSVQHRLKSDERKSSFLCFNFCKLFSPVFNSLNTNMRLFYVRQIMWGKSFKQKKTKNQLQRLPISYKFLWSVLILFFFIYNTGDNQLTLLQHKM